MHFPTTAIFALVLSGLAVAEPAAKKAPTAHITMRYSANGKCGSPTYVKVGSNHDEGACVNLKFKAQSFGVGSPSDKTQLPTGCTLRCFQKADCKGIEEDSISGPSKYNDCEDIFGGKCLSADVDCDGS